MATDFEALLTSRVEQWRGKLLDLSNGNHLINCSFSQTRGAVEIVTPDCESVWRQLAADSEAGVDPMRFPFRRDLVPPPDDWFETPDDGSTLESQPNKETKIQPDDSKLDPPDAAPAKKRKPREWNPPLDECKISKHLQKSDLLTEFTDQALDRRLRTLNGHARLAMSEQGVQAVYVAFGFLKWYESPQSKEAKRSPLMLVPVELSRSSTSSPWMIAEAEDDAIDNLCLRQRLAQDFSLDLPPLPDINELEEQGARVQYLDAVRDATSDCDRWEVEDRVVVGRFAYPKVAMWKDLGDHSNFVVSHPLCRAIGGDASMESSDTFGDVGNVPEASQLDDVMPPGEIHAILDADSSQMEAVVAARKGISFVLDGPPGTGKSQTIANIIADALSDGRTVLFVSEKVSALEVVKRRLDNRDLGDFCLECHSSKANRKSVLYSLECSLDLPEERYPSAEPKLKDAGQQRDTLNRYVRSLHRIRDPLGLSPYELYGHVSRLTRLGLANKSRCDLPDPSQVDHQTFDSWLTLLSRASDHSDVISNQEAHPWRGCKLKSRTLSLSDDIQVHFGTLAASLRRINELTAPLLADGLLATQISPTTLGPVLKQLHESLQVPSVPSSWLNAPADVAAAILERVSLEESQSELLNQLRKYRDGIAETFPNDVAHTFETDLQRMRLRCGVSFPQLIRAQSLTVANIEECIRDVATAVSRTEAAITELCHSIPTRPPEELTLSKGEMVLEFSRSIALAGQIPQEWHDRQNWPHLRSITKRALTIFASHEQLSTVFEDRLSAEGIQQLGQATLGLDITTDWNRVKGRCSGGDSRTVKTFAEKCELATLSIVEIQSARNDLLSRLGVGAGQKLAVNRLRLLTEAITTHGIPPILVDSWTAPSVRIQLAAAIDEVCEDLSELTELKEQLSERLSHRAFRPAGDTVARRAGQYTSWFRRIFGGFSDYRNEVSDLYKVAPPDDRTLLSDMARLRIYHTRLSDVEEAKSSMGNSLPPGFSGAYLEEWVQLKNSMDLAGHLLDALSETVVVRRGHSFDVPGVLAANLKLTSALEQLGQTSETLLSFAESKTPEEIHQTVSDLNACADRCVEVLELTESIYLTPPHSFEQIVRDASTAREYVQQQSELDEIFNTNSHLLPARSASLARLTWDRVQAGLNTVELLPQLFSDTEAVSAALAERVEISSLSASIERGESTVADLRDAVSRLEAGFKLDVSSAKSARDLPFTEVERLASVAGEETENYRIALDKIQEVLRDDADVNVVDFLADISRVTALRQANSDRTALSHRLKSLSVGTPKVSDVPAAQWLAKVASAGDIDPLQAYVASDDVGRKQVNRILLESKQAAEEMKESWKFLRTLFDLKTDVSTGITFAKATITEVAEHLDYLVEHSTGFDDWVRFKRWCRDMKAANLDTVLNELFDGQYLASETPDVVSARFYRQLFDHLVDTDPVIADFDMEQHERVRERFAELDEWEIRAAVARIRERQLGQSDRPKLGFTAAVSSELGILQREIAKKRKHMPLRKLFGEIPGVLQKLKPCIMMSPLSVSTFLHTDQLRFDLVIFDEASQVFPWDAIGAVYRGNQLIVAGDDKQLPPSNFFNRHDVQSDDDDEDDIADFESILSVCKAVSMPARRLRWHYRSKREPLIAFSNRHFYNSELVTFPSVRDASGDAVRLDYLPDGRWSEQKNLIEATHVANLMIEHLKTRPEKSIRVIAFSKKQQGAIEDEIYGRRKEDPIVDALLGQPLQEQFFIKNLENVQGDERDCIILSMAYGFNNAGKFLKNFGPLSKPGGQRRLNVAVTRAREEIILVASVRAVDMDLSGSTSEGAHLLKAYLKYAEMGVDTIAEANEKIAGELESSFEAEVAAALIRHGLEPVPQVGCGGFRIDLALTHPDREGEFCLGIECDGATYHSSNTARDRDRIRQGVLEALGWRIVRVWSTDWVRDPDKQILRILEAYNAATNELQTSSSEPLDHITADDDLEPTIVPVKEQERRSFATIEDVTDIDIQQITSLVLAQAGPTERDDLVKFISRKLGFGRLGQKIRKRLTDQLEKDISAGRLRRLNDKIGLLK